MYRDNIENKRKLYLGQPFDKEYDKEITEMYNRYDVVTEVKNVYNRCIQYDARQWRGTNYGKMERTDYLLSIFRLSSSLYTLSTTTIYDQR